MMMQRMGVLQRKRDGFAQMLVAVGAAGTFPAHELWIAHDLHEFLGLLENLVLAPFAESFCHTVQNNISHAA